MVARKVNKATDNNVFDNWHEAIKRRLWRSRLKRRWLAYNALRSDFDCGASLAEYISPRVNRAKLKVNEAIEQCLKLDPACTLKPLP